MKKTIFLVMTFAVLIILQNCDNFKLLSYKEWEEISGRDKKEPDVYCAGYYYSGGTTHACYWKNNELIDLQDNNLASVGRSIFINGNDIYVAGDCNGYGCYWKNGKVVSYFYKAMLINSIYVKSGIVFLSGVTNYGGNLPCFWVNSDNERYELSFSVGYANSIIVDDDFNIFIGGYSGTNGFIWRGDKMNTLEVNSSIKSIYFSNEDIYSVGLLGLIGGYWKNEKLVYVDDNPFYPAGYSSFNSIDVSKDIDVYIASSDMDNSLQNFYCSFLKNKNRYSLDGIYAYSIKVFNNDVYIGGTYSTNHVMPVTTDYKACYWKNNTQNKNILPDKSAGSEVLSLSLRK